MAASTRNCGYVSYACVCWCLYVLGTRANLLLLSSKRAIGTSSFIKAGPGTVKIFDCFHLYPPPLPPPQVLWTSPSSAVLPPVSLHSEPPQLFSFQPLYQVLIKCNISEWTALILAMLCVYIYVYRYIQLCSIRTLSTTHGAESPS